MVPFNQFFSSIFFFVTYASTTLAIPFPLTFKYPTHRMRHISHDLKLETFHPESKYETFGAGLDHPLSKRADTGLKEDAVAFVESHLGVDANSVKFQSGYEGDSAKHAYVKQVHDGVPYANTGANVAFSNDNKVVAFGSSFVKPASVPSKDPTMSVEAATATAEKALNGKFNNQPPTIEYLARADGSVALTHVIQIQNDEAGTWVEAFVDAHSGELISVTDFVAEASYRVLPITKEALTEGFETLTDPQDTTASPSGWHSDGTTETTTTAGNNVIAFKGSQATGTSPQSSSPLNFIYNQDPTQAITTSDNLNAARVNAFYVVNTIHDIAYKYGFTEAAFNFQQSNFGKGGKGNDRVTVSVQDGGGINNANFVTPPDGLSGSMRMYRWTITNPQRDGALENDIIIHENTHGISNRLTGGGTGRCLQSTEAGGMGEGWSDAMADWNWQKSRATADFVMGQYVTNNPAGIRTHPYSTSDTTNPLRYSSVGSLNEVHNIGEVWANMLHNVYAALVDALGFLDTASKDPTSTAGNAVFLHLFIDGLALQPCNPTFVSARDAIIQADANRYDGANKCILWKAFASRGLGANARSGVYTDDTSVPDGC